MTRTMSRVQSGEVCANMKLSTKPTAASCTTMRSAATAKLIANPSRNASEIPPLTTSSKAASARSVPESDT